MTITYRHGLSILELIIYVPSLFLSVFLVTRHGLRTNSGFLFLTIFALTRIVGACCDLATIDHWSTGLYIASAICSSIGLSPLMMACSGLLSRANLSIQNTTGKTCLPPLSFRGFRILTVVAMALSIAGLTSNMTAEGLAHPDVKVKVGMILYIVCWVVMVLLLAILSIRRSSIERGEKRTLLAVALASPFIFVRLMYAVCIWFLHDSKFSLLDGNVTVQLVMSVLEEFAVVFILLGVGLTLRVRSQQPSSGSEGAALSDYTSEYRTKP
ncbi:hypothetical protein N7462_005950 [Penicillium macrosclerotiorum]|uniref:uncharacterized protein n=1 Tax=Penicillium macrosclerotiorum TaxID=303699 RepID=UPI0025491E0F|nr:uncharacterized protein N7462_005950 [Penicillium macrosclerotiorum]KAJ5682785.1 hypothetical protein N7462_005950 [Penicillium macrosclerotiorum]